MEVTDAAGPQVCDDMSVEVALAVMAAARTVRLVGCDQDGQCTGLVTHAELAAVRDSCDDTDRVRLRDIVGDHGSFASPVTTMAEAEHAMRTRRLGVLPVVDEQGSAPGSLALSR
ncbi:CBS domain-containing protein [Streptomyces sp. B3I7]|nr:CBS domain-containing protein [Streptomyces sp. B3I7]